MTSPKSPTLRSRRLRTILHKLRIDRGMTLGQVSQQVDWTATKLSRIETGQRGAHPNDVRALADIYGVTGVEREALITLAREARQRGWWQSYGSALPPRFDTYLGLESEATAISSYAPEFIPGLLQSEAYARAQLLAAPTPQPESEVEKRMTVRSMRQKRLFGPTPPHCRMVLNEVALHRRIGGTSTLRDQLAHLLELSELPTIQIQVLPFTSGAHPGTHGAFMLLEFPQAEDPDIAYVEYLTGRAFLEDADEVAHYVIVLNHLRGMALNDHDSLNFIKDLAREV